MKVLWQIETGHTLPYFHINTNKKTKSSSLFSKRIQILILFTTFIYIFHSVPSSATAPKMLIGAYQRHHQESSNDARKRQLWGGSISWTTNKSASAGNTAVAFYPGVYRAFIYISVGKAVSEKIYRLDDELYLDWISSFINRGKIITW